MFFTKDGKVKSSSWREFQDKVFQKYGKPGERSVEYEEVDPEGNVVATGGICVDPECNCQGSW